MNKLTNISQIKKGMFLRIVAKRDKESIDSISVKKIIEMRRPAGDPIYDHEILLNKTRNLYFSMGMMERGESWVKEVFILKGIDKRLRSE